VAEGAKSLTVDVVTVLGDMLAVVTLGEIATVELVGSAALDPVLAESHGWVESRHVELEEALC
jgi:hypothetical protein